MGNGLEPQEELQRANQNRGHPARGEQECHGGDLGEEKRPGNRGCLRKVEREGLHSFHVRSKEGSASPLPEIARQAERG